MTLATKAGLALALSLAAAPLAAEDGRLITVTGEGSVSAKPDMATISLGVAHQAPSAAEALGEMNMAMNAVVGELRAAGIAAADMQTSQLNLSPVWSNQSDTPQTVGFTASEMLEVEVSDLDTLGPLLDVLAGKGANQFNGVSFGLSEPGPALDAARRLAVADARARAELYAEAAGVGLGPLVSLSEAGGGGMPRPMPMMRMAADSVAIAGGEVGISASVTLVYQIAE